MKSSVSLKILAAFILGTASVSFAVAQEPRKAEDAKAEATQAASFLKADAAGVSAEWLAKAKAEYPLDICMVSEDKLEGGDMGPPQDRVYRQPGKPDRLVRLCCNHCVRDFKKDPAGYLKMIDEATQAKKKPAAK